MWPHFSPLNIHTEYTALDGYDMVSYVLKDGKKFQVLLMTPSRDTWRFTIWGNWALDLVYVKDMENTEPGKAITIALKYLIENGYEAAE